MDALGHTISRRCVSKEIWYKASFRIGKCHSMLDVLHSSNAGPLGLQSSDYLPSTPRICHCKLFMLYYFLFKYPINITMPCHFQGVAWPSMHNMTGQWIPPNERSKFVTAYMGCSIGIAIFYPLFGYIIEWLSWEWIFYSSGIIGSVWYIFWVLFVFDSPAQHPRITNEEREYIEGSLKGVVEQQKSLGKVPWTSILTSKVVWLNVIAMWGSIWGLFTLMTQAPTYFKYIHGWGITMVSSFDMIER